jgi:ferredoxin
MAALRNGGLFALILAVPTALILLAALFRGRAFCAYCPVGITLGLFSSAAPLGMRLSPRCASCGLCEKKCPSGCIDPRQKKLDSERCVLCFSCAAACPSGALSYGLRWGKTAADESRRVFLKGAGKLSLLCGAAYLLGPGLKRFAPPARGGGNVSRPLPILPPGAKSLDHYRARCSGCQACAAACPAGIIKPRAPLPLPRLDYTDAGCQFNCVECGKVCPTGAISPLSLEEKKLTRIALSSLRFEHCVVNTNHESCGACAEVCPTGAVTMVPYDEPGIPYLTRPVLDDRYCIGCGACLAACPARPKALLVEAVEKQTRTIGPRPEEESGDELRIEITEDFPF